jgi:hypothetical protein
MDDMQIPLDDENEIDAELWLAALLAMTADPEQQKRVVERISAKTGLTPEKVEVVLDATLKFLMEKARSN